MKTNRLLLVRRRANNLYRKYGLTVPVNLDEIINQKQIKVKYEENQLGIDGLCQLQKEPPIIVINTEITFEKRRRFTIAHEIGHICIPWHTGLDLCSLDDPYVKIQGQKLINTQELEANTFASELLMPTEWLKETFVLDTDDLSDLVTRISNEANTSIMACFYALENVLPVGELFFVKTDAGEFWKQFRSIDTKSSYVSVVNAVLFYNEVSYWKNVFKLYQYNVIHYKILPAPDFSLLNDKYLACNSNIEELLCTITDGRMIMAMPYIDKIIEAIDDYFYVIVKIGDKIIRHFRSAKVGIRMYNNKYHDINELYGYIQENFHDFGKVDFSQGSCMLWVKELWRGGKIQKSERDPHELLKLIVDELYLPEKSRHMLQSINGVMSNINSTYKDASREQLYHYAKICFETNPKYLDFANHYYFEQYISGKTASLIAKRKK